MRYSLLLFILFTHNAFAGWYVGNGGDGIECKASPKNNLNGIYALDYILTLQDANGDDGMTPLKNWKDSSERIMKLLLDKAPTLVPSFKDFINLVYNADHSKTRVWEPAPFGLTKLDDQRITALLPENCKGTDGEFQIMQAVIRQYEGFSGTEPGHFIYKYFPEVLQRLEEQSPLQFSFLMVHEWLWDVSPNVDRNRRINRFLHSRAIESMSPAEIEATLKGMGLHLPEKQPDAFDDDAWQGYPVTEKMFFERFTKDRTMANLGQLTVDVRERDADCAEGDDTCSPQWRKSMTSYVLQERSRFFLSPSWRFTREKEYPLKIVSPEIVTSNKRTLLPGVGEIECRFIEPKNPGDANLECRFQSTALIAPLFNRYDADRLPIESWPKMKAHLTEECFRLLVKSPRKIDTLGSGANVHDLKQVMETAFTLRLRWNP